MKESVFYRFIFQPEHVIVKTETVDGFVHFINDGRKGKIEEKLFARNFTMVETE